MKLWMLIKCHENCDWRTSTLIIVFEKKPDLETIAPYLKGLSDEMGEAIAQISSLLKTGYLQTNESESYNLQFIETKKQLDLQL